jgi:hypothetical protein
LQSVFFGVDENASGEHADSQEQDIEDDSRDGRYDSSDAEDHDSGDDSRETDNQHHASGDEEGEEYVHDEH